MIWAILGGNSSPCFFPCCHAHGWRINFHFPHVCSTHISLTHTHVPKLYLWQALSVDPEEKFCTFQKMHPQSLTFGFLLCELQLCNICYWAGVFYISHLYCRAKLTTVKSFICGFFLAWYFPITLSSPAWSHTDSRGVASSWCQSRCSHKGTCYDVQVLAVIISFVVVVVWLHYWWCKLI